MPLQAKDVVKVAELARLNIAASDIPLYSEHLNSILSFIAQMDQIDTTHIAPQAHPMDAEQRLRPDEITEVDQRELLQSLTSYTAAGFYLVPQVIETKEE